MKPSTRTHNFTSSATDIQLFLGLVLAIASTGAMVMTMQSLVNGWIAKSLTICAGIALQGCLYLFSNNSNHRIRWFSYLLLVFSVIATTWFMDATWQQQQNNLIQQNRQQADQSWQAEQIRSQINELNQQIEISLNSASTDTNSNYRDRGIRTLSGLDDMRQRRDNLMAELDGLTETTTTLTEQSVFESTPQIRILMFVLIAIIIDVSAILAFGTLAAGNPEPLIQEKPATQPQWHDPKPQPQIQPQLQQREPARELIIQENLQPQPDLRPQPQPEPEPEETPDHLGTILARIRAGEYGEFVPVKQIVESEPVRHPELKAGIDQLMEEGVLIKSGNRYRHVGFEKQPELCMS